MPFISGSGDGFILDHPRRTSSSLTSLHCCPKQVEEWMCQASGLPLDELRQYMFLYTDREATQHLMRVSGGLDSLVMGEGQILAQVGCLQGLRQPLHVAAAFSNLSASVPCLLPRHMVCGPSCWIPRSRPELTLAVLACRTGEEDPRDGEGQNSGLRQAAGGAV